MPFVVGDLVRCISEYHRTELGLGDGPAMVMQVRSRDAKLFFWDRRKSAWLDHPCLERLPGEPPWAIGMANRLMRLLGGISCTVLEALPDGGTVEIAFRELPHARVDEVRALLGASMVELIFEPGSMSKLLARVKYHRP